MSLKKQAHFNTHMGRMGNQMFQYACAKGLKAQYGYTTSLSHLDKIAFFRLSPSERLFNKVKSVLFFRLWKKMWGMDVMNTELNCLHRSYLPDLVNIDKPTMIWGFFQSALYFEQAQALLRRHFRVKPKHTGDFKRFLAANHLQEGKYLAIHIRRTDYKGFTVPGLQGDDFTLPLSYYHNALQQVKAAHPELPVVFVSDDPESIGDLFPEIKNMIVSRNDAITDFLILQHAGTLVISNSTYAWWAAWLNPFAGDRIYCPQYFLGFKEQKEVPVHIYPKPWKQVSTY